MRNAIIAGIIASLIVLYFLNPILIFLARFVIKISLVAYVAYVDMIFSEMSKGRTDYSFILFMIFIIIMLFSFSMVLFSLNQRAKKHLRKRSEKDLPTTKKQSLKNLRLGLKTSLYLANILTILLFLFSSILLVKGFIEVTTIETFNQQIRILTPYVAQKKKDMLISKFSSMKTYDDFNKLQEDMNKLAKEIDIELPEFSLFRY